MEEVVEKIWGYYKVLYSGHDHKVKILYIDPGKSLSDQKHFLRNEHWFVLHGELFLDNKIYKKNDIIDIPVEKWHKPANISNKPCIICEIQYGKKCIEEDIERR